jgi:hypothetical protein
VTEDASRTLAADGRVWFRGMLTEADLAAMDTACATGAAPGARLDLAAVADALAPVNRFAAGLLPGARPVRLVAFNKSERVNWSLPWHQDRVVAVRERFDVPGFSNWTRKAGVWHVEPPIGLIERMIFARVHLDPATAGNGCLELALGTHALRRVADDAAQRVAEDESRGAELCVAERGDVLFAKALTLHRSRASQENGNRRALRIDYAADRLPAPLEWEFSS